MVKDSFSALILEYVRKVLLDLKKAFGTNSILLKKFCCHGAEEHKQFAEIRGIDSAELKYWSSPCFVTWPIATHCEKSISSMLAGDTQFPKPPNNNQTNIFTGVPLRPWDHLLANCLLCNINDSIT